MTTPVTDDDIVQGAVKYLLSQPRCVAAVGTTDIGTPLIFQHQLFYPIEGKSTTAAVVTYNGGSESANLHNTMRFPRIMLELWADPLRNMGRNTVDPGEVWRRINAVFSIFDRALHRPQGGTQMWGSVRTISCQRMAEPIVYPVPDGDGMMRAATFYGVEQG